MADPAVEIKNLGHLGIISSIFSEFNLVDRIDKLLPKSSNHKTVSHGEIIFAMPMQGLGFSNQRLYLSSEFLSHLPLTKLFGRSVSPENFNSAALGRTLDAIHLYGATRFFTD